MVSCKTLEPSRIRSQAIVSICAACTKPFNFLAGDPEEMRFECSSCRVKRKTAQIESEAVGVACGLLAIR